MTSALKCLSALNRSLVLQNSILPINKNTVAAVLTKYTLGGEVDALAPPPTHFFFKA